MATTRTARTVGDGTLLDGNGVVTCESSGIGTQQVPWPSRSQEANDRTTPEELTAAVHVTDARDQYT